MDNASNRVNCVSLVLQTNGVLTDFVSFYTLPSTVMNHTVHTHLKAAYGFYAVCTSTSWPDFMQDTLIAAKNVSDSSSLTCTMEPRYTVASLARSPRHYGHPRSVSTGWNGSTVNC